MAFAFAIDPTKSLSAYDTEMNLACSQTGLTAEVRDYLTYINVYQADGRIAGVMSRPTYFERMRGNYAWTVTLPDGTRLKSCIGPRSGFAALRKYYRMQESAA